MDIHKMALPFLNEQKLACIHDMQLHEKTRNVALTD